jgi:rhodanese-related sulfurtransferase
MKKKKTIVVDVRTPEEYQSGFIQHAVNLNVMDSAGFARSAASFDKRKKYLVYCKSGRRSAKALILMKKMGFRKVCHLSGGMEGWKGDLYKPG